MMIKKIGLLIALSGVLILGACGEQNEENSGESHQYDEGDTLHALEVELTTQPGPDELQDGEAFTVEAKVTHGDENVNDAKEVEFEFWKKGEETEEHEMIEGEFKEEGIYSIEKTVDEPGIYYVVSHVTARDMHTMPKLELTIGDVETEHAHEEGHEDSHSHGDEVSGHIMMADTVKAGEEVELTGHAMNGDDPLSEADVRFEIWKEGEEKHDFIDASEESEGEYKSSHTFTEAGTFHVKLHIEKGDLHTHKEKILTVE
ncbi:FixH family protein [Rossellomorea aquimaris]|nr:FixH family protein [Rossellomorea vietnamensis]